MEWELHQASKCNDTAAILSLLKNDVKVNTADSVDRVALHWAAAKGHEQALRLLVDFDADVDREDKYGMTPALYATWFGHLRVLQVLVNAGTTVAHRNTSGLGLLHCAAAKGHLDIVQYILDDLEDTSLNQPDQFGRTPLLLAAEKGHLHTAQCLRHHGSNINMADKEGNRSIHLAARSGFSSVVYDLLHDVDPDTKNQEGKTALHLAAENGHLWCVEALLSSGCDVHALSSSGYTALHFATERSHGEVCRLLLEGGAEVNTSTKVAPLHLAVVNNAPNIVQLFMEAGCDLNTRDRNKQTALHMAAEFRRLEIMEMLLIADADLDLRDKQGKTPLDVAIRGCFTNMVDVILKAERFYKWKLTQLDFTLDHLQEPKLVRSVLWMLAERYLQPGEWKKLANYWQFTATHVKAIEAQWTGQQSYKEHGFRMLLVWLHGITTQGKHPVKELYEGLVGIGNRPVAEKVRRKANQEEKSKTKCPVM
ncbi:ankyrin repeat and death domain-containing protein 1A-like [Amia ocellicauda]|uniref:ankyrin repeat and death domain-containing protein 1A-like n=1 Tax=Amia ocellicauda TaxID=2972642 RepID=UPI003463CE82